MRSVNKVILLGNLVKDAVESVVGAYKVFKFTVATNRKWKKNDGTEGSETEYFDVERWGDNNEFLLSVMKKGVAVYVDGRLKTDKYIDKKDGTERRVVKVAAETIIPIVASKPQAKRDDDYDNPF